MLQSLSINGFTTTKDWRDAYIKWAHTQFRHQRAKRKKNSRAKQRARRKLAQLQHKHRRHT